MYPLLQDHHIECVPVEPTFPGKATFIFPHLKKKKTYLEDFCVCESIWTVFHLLELEQEACNSVEAAIACPLMNYPTFYIDKCHDRSVIKYKIYCVYR